jgi:hypothetical protein
VSEVERFDIHGEQMVMAYDFDRVTAERNALQQRLNAADQRIDELTAKPSDAERDRLRAIIEKYPNGDPLEYDAALRAIHQTSK